MATAVQIGPGQIGAWVRRLRWAWLALAVLLAAALWFRAPIMGYARTGAAYGAHVTCSCRYIEGRSMQDCRKDFEKGMELVTVTDDPPSRSVTARFPLLSTQTATFRGDQGCLLEPWKG